ncbi:MAG: GspH/FimT family pseudopilin [bacterium]|nr:GspH/FimT family pseudopilin [bacterium]
MKRIKNRQNGVTLMELLAVIAVLGILATVGAGILRAHRPAIALYVEARQLRQTLEEARSRTIAEQQNYGVRLLEEAGVWELVLEDSGITVLSEHALSAGISYEVVPAFQNNIARFNTAGAASESGTIVLVNTDGETRSIVINPSGYVHTD